MSEFLKLKEQISALTAKAESVRQAELSKVIVEIRRQIDEFEIKPEELFPEFKTMRSAKAPGTRASRPIKYRGPNGEPWTGGPGRRPNWVREVEEAGESIEKYAVKPS